MINLRVIPVVVLLFLMEGCASMSDRASVNDDGQFAEKLKAAEQAYAAGNLDMAESLFLQTSQIRSNDPVSLYRLGIIAYRKGDNKKASEFFEKVVKIDPRHARAHFNLATIRLIQSESHFKYYIATADPKTDITKLSALIGAIEEYASSGEGQ